MLKPWVNELINETLAPVIDFAQAYPVAGLVMVVAVIGAVLAHVNS